MAKKSINVSFRLHPDVDKERQAIEVLEDLQEKGFPIREIMTDAILRLAGYTPEMFRDSGEKLTPSLFESILADFGKHLIGQIRANGGVISASQSTNADIEFDEDEDPDMVKNIAAGWAARNKR